MITLPYPHKHLWPNGPRGNVHAVSREKRKHREWAFYATVDERPVLNSERPIPVHLTVHAKAKGPLPDRDNCIAAAKIYLDGIAQALGVNDRDFAAPTVSFAPERTSQFIVRIGT